MIHYHTYYIKFRRNGKPESQTKRYQAANPGQAFQKCHREFPGAQLIQGWRRSDSKDEVVVATYESPSTVRVVAGSKAKAEQTFFGFLKEISLNPKKQVSAATHRPFATKTVANSKLKAGGLSHDPIDRRGDTSHLRNR
jgi:hypothetical protein